MFREGATLSHSARACKHAARNEPTPESLDVGLEGRSHDWVRSCCLSHSCEALYLLVSPAWVDDTSARHLSARCGCSASCRHKQRIGALADRETWTRAASLAVENSARWPK